MRICIVYDCLFPWSIGGAERWYRSLSERLAADGHEVTYLTRRQWKPGDRPAISGVRVVAVSGGGELYGPDGQRRLGPPLLFGAGVLRHLLRQGRRYDVVHLCSFPYFSLLAAFVARPLGRYRIVVDWFEVWSADYWRSYLGPAGGRIGLAVQKLCLRVPQTAHSFSRRHGLRLAEQGLGSIPVEVGGLYDGPLSPPVPGNPGEPDGGVVTAGRQIREKRVPAVVDAIAEARARGLEIGGSIYGDGPEHELVLERINARGLADVVKAPGFVDEEVLEEALSRAACLMHPSAREGYGLVVVESAARGTPIVVVDGPDNAAAELVEEGVNGFVAPSASPGDLADALERVVKAGPALRRSTREWFEENAGRLSIEGSLDAIARSYGTTPTARR